MAGIGGWFRSISSVTNSLSRFGRIAAEGQLNSTRSKFAFVNSGLALTGSIMRLGTKVVDYAGSKITGKPRKKRGKSPKSKGSYKGTNKNGTSQKGYSKNNKSDKPLTHSQQQKQYRKEDAAAKERLKAQGIDPNEKPMSFLEEDNKNEKLVMPKYKMTDSERDAMEQLALFNRENRGYNVDGSEKVEGELSKIEQLYQYLEKTSEFRESIEYTEDKKSVIVHLKPLDIQTSDEFFVNFKELILSPTEIMNPEHENYLQMANINPSKLMTSLLLDYHIERAPMLYFVINYYLKSTKK